MKNEINSTSLNTYSAWKNGFLERVEGSAPVTRIEGESKYIYYIPEIHNWIMQDPNGMLNSIQNYFQDFDSFSIRKPPELPRDAKNFLYLTQVPGEPPYDYLTNFISADSDAIFINFLHTQWATNSFYFPNSTWASGRNKLLELALDRETRQSR